MDNPFSAPRLRITRHYPRTRIDSRDSDVLEVPQAGPSRISPRTHAQGLSEDEDEDAEATPKILSRPQLDSDRNFRAPPLDSTLTAETPAARLRALLARVPGSTSASSSSRPPVPPSPSEIESDFDTPNVTAASSLARESLKDIFSRALRSPGDTPQKQRRRRNSIDVSEVEDSPRVENVLRERAKIKDKRRSMSDEEAEKFSSEWHSYAKIASPYKRVICVESSQKSESSLRSSAATFDALRQRLQTSGVAPMPHPPEQPERVYERTQRTFSLQQFISTQNAGGPGSQSDMDLSDGPTEASGETATLTKHLTREVLSASPVMTNGSMTMRMPSQMEMQSSESFSAYVRRC